MEKSGSGPGGWRAGPYLYINEQNSSGNPTNFHISTEFDIFI